MIRLFAADLDGTLLDSYPVIIAAALKAAADAGIHDEELM